MSGADPAGTARQLRAILEAIDRGEMDASPAMRYRIEGAVTAIETLLGGVTNGTDTIA